MQGTLREKGRAAGRPRFWGRLAGRALGGFMAFVVAACTPPQTEEPPQITTAPQSTTVDDGSAASFSVVASGNGLAYQWKRNGSAIAGASAATYTIAAVAPVDDGARFSVAVTNAGGSVTSREAVLGVRLLAPSVTTAPQAATTYEGRTVTFTVAAAGSAPLAYQWLRAGVEIAGATGASYTTPALAAGDNGASFSVRVTNAVSNVTSAAATLTVNPLPAVPVIVTAPLAQSVVAGHAATFTVDAAGAAPLSYQWQRDGTVLAGATAASYTTPVLTLADNGAVFAVTVTDAAGQSVTSAGAALTIAPPPVAGGEARLTFGAGHVVAIKADGSVIAWGSNNVGQLGSGPAISGTNARAVSTSAQAVAAGTYESLALGGDGLLRGWGRKFAGGTIIGGDAATTGTDVPTPSTGGWPGGVTQVVTGNGNLWALALRTDGTVWQLPGIASAIGGGLNQTARQVAGLPTIARLGAGVNGDPSAIDGSGNVWRILFTPLGGGNVSATGSRVIGLSGAVASACSGFGCIALDTAGLVHSFDIGGSSAPAPVAGLPTIKQIAVTGTGFMGLATDGRLWQWNAGATPSLVAGLSNIAEVAGGLQTVLVRLADGTVWGYGASNFGELGLGSPTSTATPVQVTGINLN